MGNVRNLRPGEREQLQAEIALLEKRQDGRREAKEAIQVVIDRKQLEIDNLYARLAACDE